LTPVLFSFATLNIDIVPDNFFNKVQRDRAGAIVSDKADVETDNGKYG
jgi:hypothetical protein